ncbi:MAG: bifunctional pyr operon transcriptional regulator/uracil phosphoribosyltransferase PyrR [Pseudomonadota bacterium]
MVIADSTRIAQWLDAMANDLDALLGDAVADTRVVGIRTGGVTIAQQLHARLGCTAPVGELNINFYRDDFSRTGIHPHVGPSALPAGIDDQTVLLVDDVLYSGRTIRAALNEVFDFGRPSRVVLAVLVARPGRELPIQADVTGLRVDAADAAHLKLSTDPLTLSQMNPRT